MFRIAATTVVACAATALSVTPSWAFSFQGVQHVRKATQLLPGGMKTMSASCPTGKRLISTGATIIAPTPNASGYIALESIVPNADLTEVSVTARAHGPGAASPWALQASAMCAIVPAEYRLERVPADSDADATDAKTRTVNCPPGKRVTGSAAAALHGAGHVAVTSMTPNVALTTVTTAAAEHEPGLVAPWRLRGYAICAHPIVDPDVTGLVMATSIVSPLPDWLFENAQRPCPPGKRLLGLGGGVYGEGVLATSIAPEPVAQPAGSSAHGARDAGAAITEWSVEANAICDYAP